MSKDAKPAPADEAEAPPKRGKKLLIIIIAAVLLLVVAGGGAAFFLLKKSDDEHADEDTEEAKPKKKDKKKDDKVEAPVFAPLEPFTVNLVPETGDQYLQVHINLQLADPAADQAIKMYMPIIRNNVTLLLSGKKPSDLASREGKEKLAAEIRDSINDTIAPPKFNKKGKKVESGDPPPIKDALFTSFIIQ